MTPIRSQGKVLQWHKGLKKVAVMADVLYFDKTICIQILSKTNSGRGFGV